MPKTSAPETLRMKVLRALLGFLMLTALIAIIDVWTEVDEEGKVLMSTVVLTVASLFSLPAAIRLDRDKMSVTGLTTLVLTGIATLTTLWLIWFEPLDPDLLGRVVASAWLWSATMALQSLVGLAVLPRDWNWLKIAAPAMVHLGAVMGTLAIHRIFLFEDWVRYTTATIYILAALANVAVLIMHMIRRQERTQQLVLDEDGDEWRDCRSGRRYHIREA